MRRDDDAPTPEAVPAATGEPPSRIGTLLPLLLALLLVATIVVSGATRTTAEPLDADAAEDRFSAARAMDATDDLLATPRVVGTPEHADAHRSLTADLEELGFQVESHDAVGTHQLGDRAFAGHTRSLIATRPGTDPTGTVVLATHYDSVVNAPGATDAGIGIAVILETVRALGPDAQRNDLVVLIVDAEEWGMLGAAAVIRDRGDEFQRPVVVLNHEARGLSGRPLVTRTAGPASTLIEGMPSPETESLFDAMFAVIPNYTDFSVYRDEGGWWGLDMAVIGEPYGYHSPADDLAHRDPGSLQHYGELTLGVTRDLGARDLQAPETEAAAPGSTVLLTMPWGVQELPVRLLHALAVAALLALLTLALPARRGEQRTPGRSLLGTLAGAGVGLLALAGAVLGGRQLWSTVREQVELALSASLGEPVVQTWFIAAEVGFALSVLALLLGLGRLALSARSLALGAALAVLLALTVASFAVPALVAWLLAPASLAALGAGLAAVLPSGIAVVVRALALLPTGWMLGRMLPILRDFGIASATGLIAATVAIAVLAVLPVLLTTQPPAAASQRRPRIVGILAMILVPVLATSALTATGIQANRTSEEPVQHAVTATIRDGQAHWESSPRSDWTAALDGTTAPTDITGPEVDVERVGEDTVRLSVTSTRDAQRLRIRAISDGAEPGMVVHERPQGGAFHAITVDGADVPAPEDASSGAPIQGANTLTVVGLDPGAHCVIDLTAAPGTTVLVEDLTDDPTVIPGWIEPPENASLAQPVVSAGTVVELRPVDPDREAKPTRGAARTRALPRLASEHHAEALP